MRSRNGSKQLEDLRGELTYTPMLAQHQEASRGNKIKSFFNFYEKNV